jgi:hypothetical protein
MPAAVSAGRGRGNGARTVVTHGVEIQAHQVGQQEGVPLGIPRPISNRHCVRVVGAAPRRSEAGRGRHVGRADPRMERGLFRMADVAVRSRGRCLNLQPVELDHATAPTRLGIDEKAGGHGCCRSKGCRDGLRLPQRSGGGRRSGTDQPAATGPPTTASAGKTPVWSGQAWLCGGCDGWRHGMARSVDGFCAVAGPDAVDARMREVGRRGRHKSSLKESIDGSWSNSTSRAAIDKATPSDNIKSRWPQETWEKTHGDGGELQSMAHGFQAVHIHLGNGSAWRSAGRRRRIGLADVPALSDGIP